MSRCRDTDVRSRIRAMPMTPFEPGNAIPHYEIEAGVRRGRQMRAEAVRDLANRIFFHGPSETAKRPAHHHGVGAN